MKTLSIETTTTVYLQENLKQDFLSLFEQGQNLPAAPTPRQLVEIATTGAAILRKDPLVLAAMQGLANGHFEYVSIDNLPIDSKLCPTPTNGFRPANKKFWTSEMTMLSLMMMAGLVPFSYWEEKFNDLVHQVAPVEGMQATRSNAGTIALDWHTDNSILNKKYRLDFLGLLGLVNQFGTPTMIASVTKAMELLSVRHRDILMQDLYRLRTPDSFDKAFGNKKIVSEWRPIINIDLMGNVIAAGNVYAAEPKTETAKTALNALGDALTEVSEEIIINPGVAVIFDNNRVFHSRGEIRGDRWLQRIFAKKNLAEIRQVCGASQNDFIFSVKPMIFE